MDPLRAGREVGRIAEEVLQHLAALPGATVRITLEVEADVRDGVSEDVQRVVDENFRMLGFKDHGFDPG